MVVALDKSLLLSHIEKQYELIAGNEIKLDIVIPHTFIGNGFAAKASFYQLLNTWVRNTNNDSVILADLASDESSLDNFIDDFGLDLCLMTAKQRRKILDHSNKQDYTKKAFDKAISKFDKSLPRIVDKEKTFIGKSDSIKVLCFDHSIYQKYQKNEWLYQDGILEESVVNKFYVAAIKHLFKYNKKELITRALKEDLSEKAVGIIKELFENTDRHATTGFGPEMGVPLNPNVRGVFMETREGNREYFNQNIEVGDPFYDYFNNPKLFKDDNEIKTFIEISVLDSGPGFAQRKSDESLDKLNPYAEKLYVIKCLTQRDTSLSKYGLKRVARYLGKRKGFFRLRTGRLCIYWDFLLHGYKPYEHQSEDAEFIAAKIKLFDWTKKDRGWSELNHASGSLITIFFPLD